MSFCREWWITWLLLPECPCRAAILWYFQDSREIQSEASGFENELHNIYAL